MNLHNKKVNYFPFAFDYWFSMPKNHENLKTSNSIVHCNLQKLLRVNFNFRSVIFLETKSSIYIYPGILHVARVLAERQFYID